VAWILAIVANLQVKGPGRVFDHKGGGDRVPVSALKVGDGSPSTTAQAKGEENSMAKGVFEPSQCAACEILISMKVEELIARNPLLYHMAHEGSWSTIRQHGLMTTAQLVDTYAPPADVRAAVLHQQRPHSVRLEHPDRGSVVIRDQAPLREQFLKLNGMTKPEWLATLNDRVFFWVRPERLTGLLTARRYRDTAHDVLTVDTASLVNMHGDRVRLSAINSGATLYPNAPERGLGTFLTIDAYPYDDMRRRQGPNKAIQEFAVIDGVPDITDHALRVERRHRDTVLEVLHQ
jgi:hypothetical protein